MNVTLKDVRLAFPSLFVAKAMVGNDGKPGKPKFSASLLFAPGTANHTALKEAVDAVGLAKWGAKWPNIKTALVAGQKLCIRDGNTKADYQGFAGNVYVAASSDIRPTVVDRDRSPLTQEDGRPYAGCYVVAKIDIWAQDNQWGKRINASLTGVQFMRDGDSFGGGAAPADAADFEELGDGADAEFQGNTSSALV